MHGLSVCQTRSFYLIICLFWIQIKVCTKYKKQKSTALLKYTQSHVTLVVYIYIIFAYYEFFVVVFRSYGF